MKESEIQIYIEQLIKDELFFDSIQDRDLVDQRYDSFFDEDFLVLHNRDMNGGNQNAMS